MLADWPDQDHWDTEGAEVMWRDVRDSHGAVLFSIDSGQRYKIEPRWGKWRCHDTWRANSWVTDHDRLSDCKKLAESAIQVRQTFIR